MRILLIKTEDATPLTTNKKHVEKIKFLSKDIQVNEVSSSNKNEIEKKLIDAEIIAGAPGSIPSIKKAKKLKWIQSFSAGVEKVLTQEVKESDVIVTNVSGIHAIPIAEHVLGFMLIFTRRFYETFKQQEKKIWKKDKKITELREKTVLVVGLGHIGTEVARLSNYLGAYVIAIKQNVKNKPDFISKVYSADQMDKILPKADFVILCLPHTEKTHHIFDKKKFKLMKKSAVIINIGRGGLINEMDLLEALDKKIIGGAGLDVTEEEPLPKNSKLWEMENVVITPHHSGWSEKYMDRAIDIFCLNLKAYLKGKPLPNLVDKKRGY